LRAPDEEARNAKLLQLRRVTVITATRLHYSSQSLLQHHGAGAHGEVTPHSDGAIDEIVMRILNLLR
jgi:hypothetical protein